MSSWGSWGNWISSTVNSVVDTSSKIVQELTASADEENVEKKEEKNNNNNNTLKFYRTDEEIEEEKRRAEESKIEYEKESELERIFLSSASTIVDGTFKTFDTVLSGGAKIIKSVETGEIGDIVSKQIESTTNTAKGVISTAIHLLNIEGDSDTEPETSEIEYNIKNNNNNNNSENNENNNSENNNVNNNDNNDNQENVNIQTVELTPSFQRYFDEYLGNIHLQALELLSTECMMKSQETQRKCDKSVSKLCSTYLQEIKEKFEEDLEEDEENDSSSSLSFNSKVESIQKEMNDLQTKAEEISNTLIAELKEKLNAFIEHTQNNHENNNNNDNENDNTESNESNENTENTENNENNEITNSEENKKDIKEFLTALTTEFLEKLHKESLVILARHSSHCVELVNRISENWLIDAKNSIASDESTEEQTSSIPEPSDSLLKLNYFKSLSNTLADDISKIASPFVNASKEIATIAKEKYSEEDLNSIEELTKTAVNNIYLDTGDANSNIFNSVAFVVPIIQWIYIIAEAKLSQLVEK